MTSRDPVTPQVAYNLIGWLEKNKDPLNDTVVDQFKKGSNALAVEIFADHPGQSAPKEEGGGKGTHTHARACTRLRTTLAQRQTGTAGLKTPGRETES